MMRAILCMVCLACLVAPSVYAETETAKVTLRNGKTYEVATTKGFPVRYRSSETPVLDAGVTTLPYFSKDCSKLPAHVVRFGWLTTKEEKIPDEIPLVGILMADLKVAGDYRVEVTTPLNESISSSFEAKGPGNIQQVFFLRAENLAIRAGVEEPGIHWFPLNFTFSDEKSNKRFQFTQWIRIDDLGAMRSMLEDMQQKYAKSRDP